MAEINKPTTSPLRPATQPIPALPGRAATTGPIAPPRPAVAGDRTASVAKDPLRKDPKAVDLGEVARVAGQLGMAMTKAQPLVDAGANTADAVAYAPDAIKTTFDWLGKRTNIDASASMGRAVERATQAGRVLGAAGAAIACKDLFDAVYPKLDVSGAGEALANLAVGVATAGDELLATPGANSLLRGVGGVAGLASSLFALARDIQDVKENGRTSSNTLGLVGNGLTAAGCALLLIPGMQALAGALLAAGAAINVVRLAVDNWDTLKDGGKGLQARVGGWIGGAAPGGPPAPTGPPRAAPPPSLA